MDENEELNLSKSSIKIAAIAIFALAVAGVTGFIAYRANQKRASSVVLPGGITYLGPSNEQKASTAPPSQPTGTVKFTINPQTKWKEYAGKIYSYTFSYPETLTLVTFPGDSSDPVAISWNGIPPQQNIMLNVANLPNEPAFKDYVNRPKREYVENWWRQFDGLKGFSSIMEFVNTKGLKGYRAKYINYANETPNDDVFFEVPNHPELVIRVANGVLDTTIFDRILDNLQWKEIK